MPFTQKLEWMARNGIAYTDNCLHDPTNSSSYLTRPQFSDTEVQTINYEEMLKNMEVKLSKALEMMGVGVDLDRVIPQTDQSVHFADCADEENGDGEAFFDALQ